MSSTKDDADRGIDYPIKIDALVYTQYVNELQRLYLKTGKGKELSICTKILPGGVPGVWFAVKSIDKNKEGHREETTTYASLEKALEIYNEIRLD